MRRTTLVIDETLFRHLKRLAAHEGRTLSDTTQEVLGLGLARRASRQRKKVALPTFSMGQPRVNVADRDRLLDLIEPRGRRSKR